MRLTTLLAERAAHPLDTVFETFCVEYRPVIYRAFRAMGLDRATAEDHTQEVLVRLWRFVQQAKTVYDAVTQRDTGTGAIYADVVRALPADSGAAMIERCVRSGWIRLVVLHDVSGYPGVSSLLAVQPAPTAETLLRQWRQVAMHMRIDAARAVGSRPAEVSLTPADAAASARMCAIPDARILSPEHWMQRAEAYRAVDIAIGALPPKQRACLQLFAGSECSCREIAATTGSGVETVKSHLAAARRSLRRYFPDGVHEAA